LATTPTGSGRFIGRVGALAVALGIGAAIANSPGIAWAQDGPSGASDSPSGGTGTSKNTGSTATTGAPGSGAAGTTTGASGEDTNISGGDPDDEDPDDEDPDDGNSDDGNLDDGNDTEQAGDDDEDEQEESTNGGGESAGPNRPTHSEAAPDHRTRKSNTRRGRDASLTAEGNTLQPQASTTSPTGATSPGAGGPEAQDPQTQEAVRTAQATDPLPASVETIFASIAPQSSKVPARVAAPPATVSTGIGGPVGTVLSALGFGSQAATGPVAPPQLPMAWAMLGWVRRELGHVDSRLVSAAGGPVAALVADEVSAAATGSPLATPQQFSAEKIAGQTANSLPVTIMKIILRHQFLAAANQLYPGGVDAENMAQLDRAVHEYARAASFQQLLLDSMNPTVVAQVAPPHFWDGRYVAGTRILYDNPDTVYRFMGVNGASEYVINGQFHDWDNVEARPTNVTFSVLEGLSGTTTTVLTVDEDFVVNDDGSFVITVGREPADGRPNHLQLTNGSTIIAARDTLGDWNSETPMSLSIKRVAGPPPSLFAQLGGFAFLGDRIVGNPLLVGLVSIIPPLPYMPPVLRGVFAAAILIVRGASEQTKYMALATNDPETGETRPVNNVSQPTSNAEFLANQLQSNGHFQLEDNQALVLTIDPGDAGYFVVPTYNVWTITDDYWNEPASLNNQQARQNVDDNGVPDGTYTVVISPTDPLAANWISTNDLNQGALSIRFQDIDPQSPNQPRIVDQQVMTHEELHGFLAEDYFITEQERLDQIELRRAGFDRRWTHT
jgi:hypothetical protein